MALSKNELDMLLEKLREKYIKYAADFSPVWFNQKAFEERYKMTIKNKMNLEAFILAEITNFEKTREKYDKKAKKSDFSENINNIILENNAKIKKYPEIIFHPDAHFEITHLYGALSEFNNLYFPIFRIILTDIEMKKIFEKFDHELSFFAIPLTKDHPLRIDDHILIISRKGITDLEIEKDRSHYLKEAAFLLHDILNFCDQLMNVKDEEWKNPIKFNTLYIEKDRKSLITKKFTGLTGYGAILEVNEYIRNILSDFRLEAFKKTY
jgi:hypothetical protein